MEKTILVVDDEKEIRDLLEINLKNEGYKVIKAENGEEGLKVLEKNNVHLIILDIMMEKMNGLEMCQKVRLEKNLPILMLSAKSENMDKIQGLLTGADDYMTKPFDTLELLVRVRVLIRRAYLLNTEIDENSITIENLKIDKLSHKVSIEDNEIILTAREFNILYLLATNRGRIFSSEEIFERVWAEEYFQSNNTVMVHMSRLRDKIKKYSKGEKIIQTVWGVGYKIEK